MNYVVKMSEIKMHENITKTTRKDGLCTETKKMLLNVADTPLN